MEPYTAEGIARREAENAEAVELHPKEYYEYELCGIVVHTGTAECGHYYSFIKERGPSPTPKWFEFNDSTVVPWDVSVSAK
jgi:ubiquitin C-terminal hydrolase